MTENKPKFTVKRFIELVIFNIRWLLLPFYIKLALDIVLLGYLFWQYREVDPREVIRFVEDVDITMIANLIEMIITGSYNSFVAKDHGYTNKNISSGVLKTKMGTSIIGISSVHLLKIFIQDPTPDMQEVIKKLSLHVAFIIGGIALAYIDFLHSKTELLDEKHEKHDKNHAKSNHDGISGFIAAYERGVRDGKQEASQKAPPGWKVQGEGLSEERPH